MGRPECSELEKTQRPRVVVLVGLPASGKSTWATQQGTAVISTDEIRWLFSDDPTNQTIHGPVFAMVRRIVRQRLELRRPVTYVDATNSTVHERRAYIKLAEWYGARPEAVFFDIPADICKERNRKRERVVPEWAIDAMVARLVPPSVREGFEAVTVYTWDSNSSAYRAPAGDSSCLK